ncbi:hypothetical protein OCU04_004586 [Sclerotinia nivalis]|uniref:Uncharacterized protein n=1 Tax=Sclerotinia nivalis TaxID=352851 RepID=A0A9X0AQQ6_9HELO|nr:hypothetical protein OCU04_004586 [Sclerotinia nivalis]
MAQMPKEMQTREDIAPKRRSMHINADLSGKLLPMQNKLLQSGQVPDRILAPDAESTSPTSAHLSKTDVSRQSEMESKDGEEATVTDESAEKIREFLQMHYLRTRSPEIAARLLYGKNSKEAKQICFDFLGGSLEVDPEEFKASFEHVELDSVLQYVAFPNVQVHPAPDPPYALDRSTGGGKGRCDMMFFFQWLRQDKGVKRILKVIVDDSVAPVHSDEVIESALQGFDVEILDWRKTDLCPEAIWKSSEKIREVYLRWSGNNAVLRGWSEPEGLRRFEDLTKVHLHVKQDLESRSRIQINIDDFCARLNDRTSITEHPRSSSLLPEQPATPPVPARTIQVRRSDEDGQAERLVTMNSADFEMKQENSLQAHRWLSCMDEFQDVFQNVWSWTMKQQRQALMEPIELALIDDGVDLLEPMLRGKISGGQTFDHGDKDANLIRQYWVSEGGHGTVMAKNITRICPMARLYVIKLETHFDHEEKKARIGTRSAAGAIDAAVDRKVQTLNNTFNNPYLGNSNSGICYFRVFT